MNSHSVCSPFTVAFKISLGDLFKALASMLLLTIVTRQNISFPGMVSVHSVHLQIELLIF